MAMAARPGAPRTLHHRVMMRWKELERDYSYCEPDFVECSDFVLGSRGRFLEESSGNTTGENRRRARNERLYNEKAKEAAKTLAAGMMAGITSPARPWFALTTGDPELDENDDVKLWLKEVQQRMLTVLGKSNFYATMFNMYLELGTFGSSVMMALEDYDDVVRFEQWTIGTYRLGLDSRRKVNSVYRRFTISIGAAVERFGEENLSDFAQGLYQRGMEDSAITFIHAIEPNDERQWGSKLAKDMAYRSVYFEERQDAQSQKSTHQEPTRLSGFRDKPFMTPRWSTTEDVAYATAWPAIDCLATNKGLQVEELDYAEAREKMHNPPLIGDSSLKQAGVDQAAGGVSYIDHMGSTGRPGLSPIYEVKPDVSALIEAIEKKEGKIDRCFFADLFLMMVESDRRQITATEVLERREEKLLMLGPVLERLSDELLDPVIQRTYLLMDNAGLIPEKPELLLERGSSAPEAQYVSVLAQAQKAVSTAALEASIGFAGNMAAVWPEVRHSVDPHQAIMDFFQAKGVAPDVLRSAKDAEEAVMAEREQQQQAMAMEQMATGAGAAQQLAGAAQSAADTSVAGDPMLDSLLQGIA